MALYQLEIDPAVQMKSSVQQIREGDGKGTVDPDASEIEVWLCPVAVSNVLKMSKVEASKMYKYIYFFLCPGNRWISIVPVMWIVRQPLRLILQKHRKHERRALQKA